MRILIIGAGDIGFHLGKRLSQEKHDITIIESNPRLVKRAQEQLDAIVVEADGASCKELEKAGIAQMDIVAAMTNQDEVNLMASRIAKKLGVSTTIARVRKPEYTRDDFLFKRKELGADIIIHPEQETARAITRLVRQANATDIIEFEEGKVQLLGVRLEPGSELIGTPLAQLGQKLGDPPVRIVAVTRKQTTHIPRGNDELEPNDQIFVIADPEYIPEFIKLTGHQDTHLEAIMILGGGLVGQFVATELGRDFNVKIIESNAERSEEIADILPDTLIIHGDGTDYDLLAAEGVVDMDAFISVTGDDETNIIATLLVKHMRVPRTIALVNKVDYLPITANIGMDAVVSKQLLTVNAVQRHIQHRQVAAIASMPGIEAQVIEFIAKPGSTITKKPLKNISFPENAIVGAVVHGEDVVIPKGDTRILQGGKAVVFSLPQAVEAVAKLFS